MKINNLIAVLEQIKKDAIKHKQKIANLEVSVEAVNDNGDIYYEPNIKVFTDINDGSISISPIN